MSVIGLAIVLVIGLAAVLVVYLLVRKTRRERDSQRQHITDERDAKASPHLSAIGDTEHGDEARSPTALGSRYTRLEDDPTYATSVELGSVLMDLSELETDLALARQSKDTDLALKIRLEMDHLENRASRLEKQLVNGPNIRPG